MKYIFSYFHAPLFSPSLLSHSSSSVVVASGAGKVTAARAGATGGEAAGAANGAATDEALLVGGGDARLSAGAAGMCPSHIAWMGRGLSFFHGECFAAKVALVSPMADAFSLLFHLPWMDALPLWLTSL